MLVAGLAYVVLWIDHPGDCTAVDVRSESWRSDGVVVEVIETCPLQSGDVVTDVDGRPLTSARTVGDAPLDYTIIRDGDAHSVSTPLIDPDPLSHLPPRPGRHYSSSSHCSPYLPPVLLCAHPSPRHSVPAHPRLGARR